MAALPDPERDPESYAYMRSAIPMGAFGFRDLVADLADSSRMKDLSSLVQESQAGIASVLAATAAMWRADLVRPEVRHGIANFLGASVLAEALPEGNGRSLRSTVMSRVGASLPERQALQRLSRLVGVHPSEMQPAEIPKAGLLRRRGALTIGDGEPTFLLIDDQFSLGYMDILGAFLFGDGLCNVQLVGPAAMEVKNVGRLECMTGPDDVLQDLGTEQIERWDVPRVLKWRGKSVAGVFLDLRLWTGSIEARRVQGNILGVAERIGFRRVGDAKAEASMAAVQGGRPESIEALTLLPLLLSHFDASVPIVLFSSTHQRQVVEALGHRRNIITCFSKPLHGGLGSAGNELRLLQAAIDEMLRLQPARYLWWRLASLRHLRSGKWSIPDNITTVQSTLAQLVCRYLMDPRPLDFFSIPWEYLEARVGWSCPTLSSYRESSDQDWTTGARRAAMRDWSHKTREVLRALQQFRDRKTHGVGWALGSGRWPAGVEEAANILCAMFVDVLDEDVQGDGRQDRNLSDRLTEWIRRRRPELTTGATRVTPKTMFEDMTVDWGEYSAVVFAEMLRSGPSISIPTREACARHVEHVMRI